MIRNWLKQGASLLGSIAIAQVSGSLVGMAAQESIKTWYPTVRKPSFNPPPSVFGPVWSVLYLSMGVANFLIKRRIRTGNVDPALASAAPRIYRTQLLVNLAWTPIFFVLKKPLVALADLVALLVLIVRTITTFRKISPAAGYLLIPYLAWSTFAAVLNASIWWLNRENSPDTPTGRPS